MKNKHILILPLVLISLLTGIFSGWFRIGWNLPVTLPSGEHGALMVGSFLGTLICIERSVSYPNRIALLVPALNAASIIFFLLAMPKTAYVFLVLGAAGLTGIYYMVYVKHKGIHILIMMAGALCYLVGNAVLFKTSFYPSVVMWWIAFLFLTITGERLELSRFILLRKTVIKQSALIILISLFFAGIFLPFHSAVGSILSAVSMIGSALWLFKYDMAIHSLKKPGQSFYSGLLLITGYVWLVLTGLFFAFGAYFGSFYDASLHAFFLGFVFMMIFAHAPVILPAVLNLKISPFGKSLYIWYILLNVTLLFRVVAVFPEVARYKMWAGMFNGIAIIGFFVNMVVLARLAKHGSLNHPVVPACSTG
ncbi:MAG TPA: hypothetical protein PKE39_00925 [Ignavibacteria bacterium]|nr:hypothetical protein [Ignavibacteria bacterium]HMQ97558.1 hypothetical protein [Ignavibacteria bacterium]